MSFQNELPPPGIYDGPKAEMGAVTAAITCAGIVDDIMAGSLVSGNQKRFQRDPAKRRGHSILSLPCGEQKRHNLF
jgi:hypothetical protein